MNTNTTTANPDESLPPGDSDTLHPDQIVGVVIMGQVSAYFSIFVLAIACALVFPPVFFPNYELVVGTLISFGVFSLPFISRPFARFIFRRLDERAGRAAKITVAMFVLGGSTICMGFIPGYGEIGIVAPVLLCVACIGQGIGSGGVWEGLPIIMMLNAPEKKRSWYAMVPQLGGPIGFFIAASIFYVLTNFLTSEEFTSWGWRFPFFVALALQVVALFARLRLIQTPEYKNAVEQHYLRGSSVRAVWQNHWKQVILGAYMPLCSYALFYLVTIFPLGFVMLHEGMPVPDLLVLQMAGGLLAVFTCILSGPLADRYGRRRFLIIVTAVIGVLSFFIVDLLENPWIFVLFGFCLLGLSFGQSGGTLPHRFKPEYRYTGVAVTTDLGWLFGAAFAPIVALGLTLWFGLEFAGYYLLSGVIATLVALYIVQRMSRGSRV